KTAAARYQLFIRTEGINIGTDIPGRIIPVPSAHVGDVDVRIGYVQVGEVPSLKGVWRLGRNVVVLRMGNCAHRGNEQKQRTNNSIHYRTSGWRNLPHDATGEQCSKQTSRMG